MHVKFNPNGPAYISSRVPTYENNPYPHIRWRKPAPMPHKSSLAKAVVRAEQVVIGSRDYLLHEGEAESVRSLLPNAIDDATQDIPLPRIDSHRWRWRVAKWLAKALGAEFVSCVMPCCAPRRRTRSLP